MLDVWATLKNIVKRGKQTEPAKDSSDHQKVKVGYMGQTREINQISPYGLFSSAPTGSEYLIFSSQANADALYGLGNDYKNRIKNLKEGEVALYNTKTQALIHFKDDGSIYLYSSEGVKVETTGDIDLIGANINITGVLNINGAPYLTHTHSGVTVGGGSTGGVV